MNSLNQQLRSKENKFVDEIEKDNYKMRQTKIKRDDNSPGLTKYLQ